MEQCYEILVDEGPVLVPARRFGSQPTLGRIAAMLEVEPIDDKYMRTIDGFVVRLESLTDATEWRAFHGRYDAVRYLLRLAHLTIRDPDLHQELEDEFQQLTDQRRA